MAEAGRVGLAEAARAALAAREGGEAVVVIGRADAAGEGRRLLVYEDRSRGSLGDAAIDAAIDAAGRAMGQRLLREIDDGNSAVAEEVLTGGATASVPLYAEVHRAPARLFVVGAGPIALPLARLGVLLGYPVVVLDDRQEFATGERFPAASEVRRVDFEDPFADAAPGPADAVVLVTRAHRYDFDCLRRLVDATAPPRYIGMVGSRRRVRAAFRALLDAGIAAERLSRVHAPIGLDIGAETPAEIAVSIAAELVAVRRGVAGSGSLRDRERIVERFLSEPAITRTQGED